MIGLGWFLRGKKCNHILYISNNFLQTDDFYAIFMLTKGFISCTENPVNSQKIWLFKDNNFIMDSAVTYFEGSYHCLQWFAKILILNTF